MINHCFEDKVLFTITADQDKAVKEVIKAIRKEEWHKHERDREIAETVLQLKDEWNQRGVSSHSAALA